MIDFISTAAAATNGAAAQSPNPWSSILMLGGLIAVFYFMILRPQTKRNKEHRALILNLNKGDEVVTNGGLIGKVIKVDDAFLTLNITGDIEIKVQKSSVMSILPKGTIASL